MTHRWLVAAGVLTLSFASLEVKPLEAQAPVSATNRYTIPPTTYTPPRTPWGHPDLQGVYDYQTLLNIERPASLAGKKAFASEAEFNEWAKTGARANAISLDSPERNVGVGAYNEFWNSRNFVKDLRTSLIEDPPDGRFPPLTPEGERRRKEIIAGGYGRDAMATWEDAISMTRCIASQTPNGPHMYNGGAYIMQTPGSVLIVRERLDTRMIPLDGRPHIGQRIREWNGDSVGHFEGNVLVVDTTNFTDKQRGGGGSGAIVPSGVPFGNFHVVEHFVPVSANRIHYYATVEDPKTWTRPWTVMLPWERQPGYQIFEYACHEGNISVGNALRCERLQGR